MALPRRVRRRWSGRIFSAQERPKQESREQEAARCQAAPLWPFELDRALVALSVSRSFVLIAVDARRGQVVQVRRVAAVRAAAAVIDVPCAAFAASAVVEAAQALLAVDAAPA